MRGSTLGMELIFSKEDEKEITNYIQDLSKTFYGIFVSKLKRYVFCFAVQKKGDLLNI